jgi:hypothetical protein
MKGSVSAEAVVTAEKDESRQRCLKLGALLPSEAKAGAVSGLIRLSHYRIGAIALRLAISPQFPHRPMEDPLLWGRGGGQCRNHAKAQARKGSDRDPL